MGILLFYSAVDAHAFVIHNGTAIINVIYDELPVNVLNYSLYDTGTGITFGVWNITPLDLNDEFNFTTQYLMNGYYSFYIKARDTDYNVVEQTQEFQVDHEGFGVWLIDPPVGIGQTIPYNITVGSEVRSFCRWGDNVNYNCPNMSCLFDTLYWSYNITGNRTNHKIVDLYSTPAPYSEIITVCKLNATTVPLEDQSFGATTFHVGYDLVNPSITTVNATPNPVEDPFNRITNITVITNENTVCRLYRNAGIFAQGNINRFFDGENRTEFSSYSTIHNIFLSYPVSIPPQIMMNYNITCFDYSQRNVSQMFTVEVNLNGNLAILLVEPTPYITPPPDAFVSGYANFRIRTNIQATAGCTVAVNGEAPQAMTLYNPPYGWEYNSINWVLGINNITVQCSNSQSNPTKTYAIMYDDQDPVMHPIDLNAATCGLDGFSFGLNASDAGSGVAYYMYTITRNGEILVDWTQTTENVIDYIAVLIDGETYVVEAYAVDYAGLESAHASDTILAEAPNAVNCDFTKPSINITVVGQYAAEVFVACQDNVGCNEDYFEYGTVEIGGDCGLIPEGSWTQHPYEILVLDPWTYGHVLFCARVSDLNSNTNSDSRVIDLNLPACGNGIVENVPALGYLEACDRTNFSGLNCTNFGNPPYLRGNLICSEDCHSILEDNCDSGNGYCGDNEINQFTEGYNPEQCDGTLAAGDWGNIANCMDFGFTGGTLTCNPPSTSLDDMCKFNTSQCTIGGNPLTGCGGPQGMLNPGEQCEPEKSFSWTLTCPDFNGFVEGEIYCDYDCRYNINPCKGPTPPPDCNNGYPEPGEDCQPGDSPIPCDNPPYTTGMKQCVNCQWDTSQCGIAPFCGDGIKQTPNYYGQNELCDGNDFGILTCSDFGGANPYTGGYLRCDSGCNVDTSNCNKGSGFCGDGGINHSSDGINPEQCDGNPGDARYDWGNINGCTDFGFTGGILTCNNYDASFDDMCRFNTSQCTSNYGYGICGGGETALLNIREQCDDMTQPLTCVDFDSFGEGNVQCVSCRYDINGCQPPILPPVCGDGNIEYDKGEECESGDTISCADIGPWSGGTATCAPPNTTNQCQWDISSCEMPPVPGQCGNGVREDPERCDGGELGGATCQSFGFMGGILQCNSACDWDTGNCNAGAGYCGNNQIDNLLYEQCDGTAWGGITSCADFGFIGGTLTCNTHSVDMEYACKFNTSQCTPNIINPLPYCDAGGGTATTTLDKGEQCELTKTPLALGCLKFDSYTGGGISCDGSCIYDITACEFVYTAECGNGVVEPGEQCEGSGTKDCSLFGGYIGGTATCNPSTCQYNFAQCIPEPICGNNVAEGYEICDGTDLGYLECTDLIGFIGGNLGCYGDCTLNTENCDTGQGYCGDNIINNLYNEQCDGNKWGQITGCTDFGFTGGTLSCNGCIFDTSQCTATRPVGTCGDTHINPIEQCEPSRSFNLTCPRFDHFNQGNLACGYNCLFDISGCYRINDPNCGNGVIEAGEQCDGTNLGDLTECWQIDLNFVGGSLSCNAPGTANECMYNLNACTFGDIEGYCGDGVRNGLEKCDGIDTGTMQCTDIDAFIGGTLGCYDDCTFNKNNCDRGFGYCGDDIINNFPLEQCDGSNWGSNITGCKDFGFTGGSLSCNDCGFDTSQCTNNAPLGNCGDDILNAGEQCESTIPLTLACRNFDHFVEGGVYCNNCEYDISQCYIPPDPQCGNNIIEQGETCDGTDMGQTNWCPDIDSRYTGGTLTCNPPGQSSQCLLNTTQCVLPPEPEICGNGVVDNHPFEECDGSNLNGLTCINLDFTGGTLSCYDAGAQNECQFNTESCTTPNGDGVCGDGEINPGEDCEPGLSLTITCYDIDNYDGGTLTCNQDCTFNPEQCVEPVQSGYCGDGAISGFEQCDGTNLQISCSDINGFVGGILSCFSPDSYTGCMWNSENCDLGYGYCGDGKINNFPGEQCDGFAWGGIVDCTDFGFSGGSLSCVGCSFDTSQCTGIVGVCGDAVVNVNEQCESTRPFTVSCTDFDSFIGGSLGCADCKYDIGQCELPTLSTCGDGIISGLEECDGYELNGLQCTDLDTEFIGGTLGCFASGELNECQYDLSECIAADAGYCGDDLINNFPNEECDGSNWGDITGCSNFGYTGGILSCNGCGFDVSQCITPYIDGFCGDGLINPGEECDPALTLGIACQDLGFAGGTMGCYASGASACSLDISACQPIIPDSLCGDGAATGFEQCDSNDLRNITCPDIDDFIGGALTCYEPGSYQECYWNTENCDVGYGYCGDNKINSFPNEACDGTDWGNIKNCKDFGFTGGALACNGCQFDTSQCTAKVPVGVCGDQVMNSGEECETGVTFALGCKDFDKFIGGALACNYATCQYDITGCMLPTQSICGDGLITGGEQCDGTTLGNIDKCVEVDDRFISGDVTCDSNCKFNLNSCVLAETAGVCNNGVVETGEQCDAGTIILQCTDFGLSNGFLGCNNDCSANTTSCINPLTLPPSCGNGLLESGEQCDGTVSKTMAQFYSCLNDVVCAPDCTVECSVPGANEKCYNNALDGDETDIDCGGTCPNCDTGDSCISDGDCASGNCVDNVCIEHHCTNGDIDVGESSVDCGGDCEPCGIGLSCYYNDDCASGSCIDGICAEAYTEGFGEKANPVGLGLLIAGILLILGGGGYVIYMTYFAKKPPKYAQSIESEAVKTPVKGPSIFQSKKFQQKAAQNLEKRKKLLEGFEEDESGIHKIGQKGEEEDSGEKGKEEEKSEDGFVSLEELKSKASKGSAMKKLEKIVSPEKAGGKEAVKPDEKDISEKDAEEKTGESGTEKLKEKLSKKSKTKETLKETKAQRRRKHESDTFRALRQVTTEDIGNRINDMSEENDPGRVGDILRSEKISHENAAELFSNIDRDKLTSDAFQEILSELLKSGKLNKDTVSSVLFENIEKGKLSKRDAAKIMSKLKLI